MQLTFGLALACVAALVYFPVLRHTAMADQMGSIAASLGGAVAAGGYSVT